MSHQNCRVLGGSFCERPGAVEQLQAQIQTGSSRIAGAAATRLGQLQATGIPPIALLPDPGGAVMRAELRAAKLTQPSRRRFAAAKRRKKIRRFKKRK